eukprot:SAG31_NODE_45398_length_259_cov_0.637500_1_plen_35_part_10
MCKDLAATGIAESVSLRAVSRPAALGSTAQHNTIS